VENDARSAVPWPGNARREPRLSDPYYLALSGLNRHLEAAIQRELGGRRDLVVLDLGCGEKPYYPWFAPHAARYIGVDAYPGRLVDHVCPAENVAALAAETADALLCTQVLEHVLDPGQVVREIHRLLKPGGVCLLTTHGTFPYHGQPRDYWRWTHEGLARAFETAAPFSRVQVEATEGIASAIGGLLVFYGASLGARYPWLQPLAIAQRWLLGTLAPRLDRPLGWLFEANPIAINYLVIAHK
jgi:SAM-dependent methyltransferase